MDRRHGTGNAIIIGCLTAMMGHVRVSEHLRHNCLESFRPRANASKVVSIPSRDTL
ncbi:hypothetical protein DPMN_194375 [Dreissena polymorpha]|uniref:Uncharacterized protein n=1 Tax=Dreissena polymorpha TaxID=45954 RepID=A0A9D3Y0C3_DREPO|nr:hypothetical protein DPMN_194375 [Dreissena polymorpha]